MASYLALRVGPYASASSWWTAARQRGDIPAPIAALLNGRERVEVTSDEAAQALAWAGGVTGWNAADPKPVWLYQPSGALPGG
jgi:hypothetical protein